VRDGRRTKINARASLDGFTIRRQAAVNRYSGKAQYYIAGKIRQMGVTFALTPEMESELRNVGATNDLIAAIREKNSDLAPSFSVSGFAHYEKGEYDLAIRDYTKAIELKPDGAFYLNRGLAYYYKATMKKPLKIIRRPLS
jgi:tetratricopeptide (TPR) repeat protein